MSIRGSLLVIGLGGVFILILLGLFYASNQQHLVIYALIGLIVVCGATAALIWTIRLEKKA